MPHALEDFAAECRAILGAGNHPAGRERVAALLRERLRDEGFVAALFDDDTPERKVLYEDPQLGFTILAHQYSGPRSSAPHDHGPSWAIYGQASGQTEMSDYDLVRAASTEQSGLARRTRTYTLQPGDAHVYNEGDLHAPSRAGPTRLLRIEGVNMDRVRRLRFEAVAD